MNRFYDRSVNSFFDSIKFYDRDYYLLDHETHDSVVENGKGFVDFVVEVPVIDDKWESMIRINDNRNVVFDFNSFKTVFNDQKINMLPLTVSFNNSLDKCDINVDMDNHHIVICGHNSKSVYKYIEGTIHWIVPEESA